MSLSVGATVGFLIIHLILLYSLLALIVFYGCLFYKKRREMIIRKRYAMIVFIINLSVIPMFAITFPFIYIKWFISNIKLDQGIIWSLTYPFCAYGIWTRSTWTRSIWTRSIWTRSIWTRSIWTRSIWTRNITDPWYWNPECISRINLGAEVCILVIQEF
eukprot:74831_1